MPALSDIDLVLVLDPGAWEDAARVHRRWESLRRRAPLVAQLVDRPRAHPLDELDGLLGRSSYTFGLDPGTGSDRPSAGVEGTARLDRGRALERPGIVATTAGWHRIAGPRRPLREPARDDQETRIAVWLELVYLWKRAYGALTDPTPPHTAALCVKLVTEPTRALAWLASRDRLETRAAALARTAELLPEHAAEVDEVARIARDVRRLPTPPLAAAVVLLVELTRLVALELARQLAPVATTTVRLRTTPSASGLPLCDWPALTAVGAPEEVFVPCAGLTLSAIETALAASRDGSLIGLHGEGLLAFPSQIRGRVALRAVACELTDPVSTALLRDHTAASFADVDGWSAEHWARRALAESRHALQAAPDDVRVVLRAARAALFRESLDGPEPELTLTPAATLSALRARAPRLSDSAAAAVDEALAPGGQDEPPAQAVAELHTAVAALAGRVA